ncbi:MFS transporter [Microbispora sp. KK1-11]|uniref:MFS transporter n=1 Tax=Microbispora sp. KK1-11 TaxID=2053005 RepID=UPI001C8E8BD1|nr:MFS transporter [Microbispora sp. KK1-11]
MTTSTFPNARQQLILAVLMVCSLLIWLDNTVLSTTLETLADPVRGLNASPAELQWATGSYTLAFATLMFTAGALGDRFGHRVVLAAGLVVFAASSVWAAYAGDAGQPIALRAVRKPAAAGGAPEPARDGGPTADETAPRSGVEDLTPREGAGVGAR